MKIPPRPLWIKTQSRHYVETKMWNFVRFLDRYCDAIWGIWFTRGAGNITVFSFSNIFYEHLSPFSKLKEGLSP